jgi:hypothetical protein
MGQIGLHDCHANGRRYAKFIFGKAHDPKKWEPVFGSDHAQKC